MCEGLLGSAPCLLRACARSTEPTPGRAVGVAWKMETEMGLLLLRARLPCIQTALTACSSTHSATGGLLLGSERPTGGTRDKMPLKDLFTRKKKSASPAAAGSGESSNVAMQSQPLFALPGSVARHAKPTAQS